MPATAEQWSTPENDPEAGWDADALAALPEFLKEQRRAQAKDQAREARELLKFRLYDEQADELAGRLEGCGLPFPLVCATCGEEHVVETRCKQRWCPACAWGIQMERMARFAGAINLMQWPMMLTLTQPNSADPESLRALKESWAKMRRRKLVASKVLGGVTTFEVTNTGNGWHPHLHAVIDCKWLALHVPPPQFGDPPDVVKSKCDHARQELSDLWGSIIGSPEAIVLAARVKDKTAARYALKYATKSEELLACKERISPLIRVLQKTRLVAAFGNLHGRIQEMDTDEAPSVECPHCHDEKSLVPWSVIDILKRRQEAAPGPSRIHDPVRK